MNTENQSDADGADKNAAVALDDATLATMTRNQVLQLCPEQRMRWFYLRQVNHSELSRVARDLDELLDPNNDTKIIAIIGPTGIGKTTLATNILTKLVDRFTSQRQPHEVPIIYVSAPANGDKSMSWKTLYRRIQTAAGEKHIDLQRQTQVSEGEIHAVRGERASLAHMREMLEAVIRKRNVRVIVIDEALHLLRFDQNAAIMDTLKSLADIHQTKLVLIGTYQIAPLMIEYGQLARRSAILHYRRYAIRQNSNPQKLTDEQTSFKEAVVKLQSQWPCAEVPHLEAIWDALMNASLGSVGLLKSQLLQLASLQMKRKGEKFEAKDLQRAVKPPKQLQKIEAETLAGEQDLIGACYGEADFGSEEVMTALFTRLKGAGRG
ncbi:ATP-binding protein [Roseateles sp.]|uniref:ATP-binding protein n=1 Tax=Roseateles sp. TaxID=1971397 RepID=UPI003265CA93